VVTRPSLGLRLPKVSLTVQNREERITQQKADLEPGVKTSRVRCSLDSKDHIPIYQVATAYRDIEGDDFKEDRPIGAKIKLSRSFVEFSRNFNFSFSCS